MGKIEELRVVMIERVEEITRKLLQGKEIELVDVTYRREGAAMMLRVTVDKKGGVSVDECAWVNEKLGQKLDQENFLIEAYALEVCSPGLDRPLKTRHDFQKVRGELIRVHTFAPLDDKREHVGKVVECDDSMVTIELKNTEQKKSIPLDKISKARLEIEI